MLWIALLWGCSGEPPEPPEPPPEPEPVAEAADQRADDAVTIKPMAQLPAGMPNLRETGSNNLALHTMEGTVKLAEFALPPAVKEMDRTFDLVAMELPNPKNVQRTMKVVRAKLPFTVPSDEQTFRPIGMRVYNDGVEIPFGKGSAPRATRPTWRINGRSLVLSLEEVPKEGDLKIHYPRPSEWLDANVPGRGEAKGMEFLRSQVTVRQETREGITIPTGTSVEWTVKVPSKAPRFEAFVRLMDTPIAQLKPAPNTVKLQAVTADGKVVEIASELLKPSKRTDPPFTKWSAELSAFAGKEVTLRLITSGQKTAWSFIGSPSVWGTPNKEVRHVVVIGLDTTRPDHFSLNGYGRPTTPELDKIAESALVFDKAWSVAPRTRPAFRSATTGKRPLEAVHAKNIGQVFQEHGFATAGIVANVHLQPRFDFTDGFDHWLFDGTADANEQVDRALAWLEANKDRDTYMFLHFMDPHMPYGAPGEYQDKYVEQPDPSIPPKIRRHEVLNRMARNSISDVGKEYLEALHDGEMSFMDREVARFYRGVDELPGNSLIVMHSDHGEEFWEHDGFEHNHTLYDEVTRAILWVRPGGGLPKGHRMPTPASIMDIGPTLYDAVGFTDTPTTHGRSLIELADGKPDGDWSRPIPIAYMQYAHDRWGTVVKGHKYILHTGSGLEELYALDTDPGELKNLAEGTDLAPYRAALSTAHNLEVNPGWRIHLKLHGSKAPLVVTLPKAAKHAFVLDPELAAEKRANIEWGEIPKKSIEDVGELEVSSDGRTLTFTPGDKPDGILFVHFDQPQPADAAKLMLGEATLETTGEALKASWSEERHEVEIVQGTVLVPPKSEAERMGLTKGEEGSDDDTEMLKELGYMEDDH